MTFVLRGLRKAEAQDALSGIMTFVLRGLRKAEAQNALSAIEWRTVRVTFDFTSFPTCQISSHLPQVQLMKCSPWGYSQMRPLLKFDFNLAQIQWRGRFLQKLKTLNSEFSAANDPVPHSASSESKQAHKHCMSLLTPISEKYDATSHDSLYLCIESDSMSLLECEGEESRRENRRGREKVRPESQHHYMQKLLLTVMLGSWLI